MGHRFIPYGESSLGQHYSQQGLGQQWGLFPAGPRSGDLLSGAGKEGLWKWFAGPGFLPRVLGRR